MEWYYYAIIGAAAIIVILLLVALFGNNQENEAAAEPEKVVAEETPAKPEKVVAKEEPAKPEKAAVEEEPAKPKKVVAEKKAEPAKRNKPAPYHVSQNKDKKSARFKEWRVRKEGSNKTIKYFQTQKEAIAYAEELADSADSSIVIHKVDGSIRKQDYSK